MSNPAQPSGLGLYAKAIVAAFVVGLGVLKTAQADGVVETVEWISLAVAFIVALGGVWAIPNVPDSVRVYGKAIFAGLAGGLGSLGAGLSDGVLISAEITDAVIMLVVSTGLVGIVPNALSSDPVNARGQLVPLTTEVKAEIAAEGTTQTLTKNGVVYVSEPPAGNPDPDEFGTL